MGENMIWDQQTDAWRVKGYLNWFVTKVGGWFNLKNLQLMNTGHGTWRNGISVG